MSRVSVEPTPVLRHPSRAWTHLLEKSDVVLEDGSRRRSWAAAEERRPGRTTYLIQLALESGLVP